MRGTPIASMMPVFQSAGFTVLGHDPMVTPEVIRQYGGEPVSLDKAFSDSDAVLIINDHPDYRAIQVESMLTDGRPRLIFDSWRILDEAAVTDRNIVTGRKPDDVEAFTNALIDLIEDRPEVTEIDLANETAA